MNITYKISEENYLTFQLYLASKSQNIIKRRKRTRLVVPAVYSIFAISLIYLESTYAAIGFGSFGLIWFFFYPLWEKKKYHKHYLKFIRENYQNRIGVDVHLEIQDEHFFTSSNGSEAKIQLNQIKQIIELKEVILIRLDITQAFVIPKDQVKDLAALITELKELAKKLSVHYSEELNWEWK